MFPQETGGKKKSLFPDEEVQNIVGTMIYLGVLSCTVIRQLEDSNFALD